MSFRAVKSSGLRAAGVAVLAFLACIGPAAAAKRAQPVAPIRIGLTLGLTGAYARIAVYQGEGYRLWAEDVNQRGGLLGRPVELVLRDDRSDPAVARDQYHAFVSENRVDFLFSPFSSEITEAILPLTADHDYPLIIAGASADSLFRKGYPHVFGLLAPTSKHALGFLELLVQQGIDRVAVFSEESLFSRAMTGGIEKWASRLGLTIALNEKISPGADRFRKLAAHARDAGAQAVVLASYVEDAVALHRAFAAVGWRPRAYYVPVELLASEYRALLGRGAEGLFSTVQWALPGTPPSSSRRRFSRSYEAAYGHAPVFVAAAAYAAGQVLEEAVRRTGTLDRGAVRDALAAMDMNTVIGRYGVDGAGVQIQQVNHIIQIQHDAIEIVWPPEAHTAMPRFP